MQILPNDLPKGLRWIQACLDHHEQQSLLENIREIACRAPLFTPKMPRTGKPMSVRMTNYGSLGWVTDRENGYRYQSNHPETGKPWPGIPEKLISLWEEFSGFPAPPEACLVNYYDANAKMGLHQDRDENVFTAPVLSVSLGDTCLFRIGGTSRKEPTRSFKLESGDLLLLSGEARLAFHGVDRIYPGTSTLLKQEGRINLTLRRVTQPGQ